MGHQRFHLAPFPQAVLHEVRAEAAAFGAGVDALSCGGVVAVWAALSPRWVLADLACAMRGVTVPEGALRRRRGW